MKFKISPEIKLDLQRLVETRLLITASSGGGKSMTIRTLLEATHGVFPQIILDVEGEFSTLREGFDYILVGKNGDIPADPRTAQLLARKLLELNASAIIDLYELKHSEKHRFVKLFIETLVDSPKELWGPRLLVIDEAHQFCPEKGAGVSEAWEAVIDVCEKGRKRGLGAILATQRLSKLNKDAAAECQNKIIGLANIDIDRERSAKELGFTHKEDVISLRDLEAGEFFVIGPALSKTVQKTRINLAKTSHPKIGKYSSKAPMATAKVKQLLEKLKDLPQEAEKELKTQADMMSEIHRLKMELKKVPAPIVEKVDIAAIEKKIRAEMTKAFSESVRQWMKERLKAIQNFVTASNDWVPPVPIEMHVHQPIKPATLNALKEVALKVNRVIPAGTLITQDDIIKFGACERAIVGFLAFKPERTWTKIQVAVGTGYSANSGGFNNALGKLRSAGAIKGGGDSLQLADPSICPGEAPKENPLEAWKSNLGKCERVIWDNILSDPSKVWTKEELGEVTGYAPTSGGFNNALGRLHSLCLIKRDNGVIRIHPENEF